jgi:hypothetical protein
MGSSTCMRTERLGRMMVVGLLAVLSAGELLGATAAPTSRGPSAHTPDFALAVHEGVVSLHAQNASLKAIVEAIGRQLAIDVVSRIPDDERITLAFAALPLAEALKRFRPYVNYLVQEDATKASGTIRQLIVISKRLAGGPPRPARTRRGGPTRAAAECLQPSRPDTPPALSLRV